MVLSSKGLALLLALFISIITTSFLSLVENVETIALIVAFVTSFSSTYLLGYILLEFLIFKEITQIYDSIEKLKESNPVTKFRANPNPLSPFRQIHKEIFVFAADMQSEIAELKRLENFRREFLADVSHELKTPIFAAQGFVHTLLDGAIKDKNVRDKFLKKAAKSLDGLDELVHDLLVISQMESGQITMHMEDFDLYELTREIIEQIENKAEKKEVGIKFKRGTKNTWVHADQRRIHQVMTNLISNAVKYTEPGGKVIVSFHRQMEKIRIMISDTGIGIPKEHQARIFERFYRIDKSRSKGKGGSGLGLAIVKHITEAHNTHVKVESEEGKGSIFSFELPVGKEAPIEAGNPG